MVSTDVDVVVAKTGRAVVGIDRLTSLEAAFMIAESALTAEAKVAPPLRSVTARAHPPTAPDAP
jgi:hypothetical protein